MAWMWGIGARFAVLYFAIVVRYAFWHPDRQAP